MINVKMISEYIDSFAPYTSKCEWDNCGILVGDPLKYINKVGFTLDLTEETLEKAKELEIDLIITHHPIIFKAQKNFVSGDLSYELAVNSISAISAHTCFDCAKGGVNDVLCEILDIENPEGVPCDECVVPMARIGDVSETTTKEFARKVSDKLCTVCRVVDCGKTVKRVAVCGGAGMDFIDDVIKLGADTYVTGDCSHHQFLLAKEKGINLIAAGHFETENPAMLRLMDIIGAEFPGLELHSLCQSNPVEFIG